MTIFAHGFKRVAVVGGGVFGCTAASKLAENGFVVDLYEKNSQLFSAASAINQYRLHRGYHYPRSIETALACVSGLKSFYAEFADAVVSGQYDHYYAISREQSKVSGNEYLNFLNAAGLEYRISSLPILNAENVELVVAAEECLFDPKKLKMLCRQKVQSSGVRVHANSSVSMRDLEPYDLVVNATYAGYNELTPETRQIQLQFELCEKLVLRLPIEYKNQSVVVMDGPFMCIDPLPGTPYHVMGNVVHAIHHSSTGLSPSPSPQFAAVLNNGIISNPKVTNFELFMHSAADYFWGIENCDHIGSMFTYRTVLPFNESDDARPTLVTQINDRLINVFSGKVCTCVDAANQVVEIAKQ